MRPARRWTRSAEGQWPGAGQRAAVRGCGPSAACGCGVWVRPCRIGRVAVVSQANGGRSRDAGSLSRLRACRTGLAGSGHKERRDDRREDRASGAPRAGGYHAAKAAASHHEVGRRALLAHLAGADEVVKRRPRLCDRRVRVVAVDLVEVDVVCAEPSQALLALGEDGGAREPRALGPGAPAPVRRAADRRSSCSKDHPRHLETRTSRAHIAHEFSRCCCGLGQAGLPVPCRRDVNRGPAATLRQACLM